MQQTLREAVGTCASRHLDSIITASPASLVVILGAKARDQLRSVWRLPTEFGSVRTVGMNEEVNLVEADLGGRGRTVAYLPHPVGMTKKRTFSACYPERFDDLLRIVGNG